VKGLKRGSIPARLMRRDEEFAINSLAKVYSGTWCPGENPPDAYLILGSRNIPVEISTLTQHVTDERGTHSRLTDDLATVRFADSINDNLKDVIPDGIAIGLVLSSPIMRLQKTKRQLTEIIRSHIGNLSSLKTDMNVTINDNKVRIYLNEHGETKYKKVSAAIMNRNSSPDLLSNAAYILEDRIKTKAKKCSHLRGCDGIWLALLNEYWLTDADTYRLALSRMSLDHPFARIVLVNGDGSISALFGK
jgi:hypothetical protein